MQELSLKEQVFLRRLSSCSQNKLMSQNSNQKKPVLSKAEKIQNVSGSIHSSSALLSTDIKSKYKEFFQSKSNFKKSSSIYNFKGFKKILDAQNHKFSLHIIPTLGIEFIQTLCQRTIEILNKSVTPFCAFHGATESLKLKNVSFIFERLPNFFKQVLYFCELSINKCVIAIGIGVSKKKAKVATAEVAVKTLINLSRQESQTLETVSLELNTCKLPVTRNVIKSDYTLDQANQRLIKKQKRDLCGDKDAVINSNEISEEEMRLLEYFSQKICMWPKHKHPYYIIHEALEALCMKNCVYYKTVEKSKLWAAGCERNLVFNGIIIATGKGFDIQEAEKNAALLSFAKLQNLHEYEVVDCMLKKRKSNLISKSSNCDAENYNNDEISEFCCPVPENCHDEISGLPNPILENCNNDNIPGLTLLENSSNNSNIKILGLPFLENNDKFLGLSNIIQENCNNDKFLGLSNPILENCSNDKSPGLSNHILENCNNDKFLGLSNPILENCSNDKSHGLSNHILENCNNDKIPGISHPLLENCSKDKICGLSNLIPMSSKPILKDSHGKFILNEVLFNNSISKGFVLMSNACNFNRNVKNMLSESFTYCHKKFGYHHEEIYKDGTTLHKVDLLVDKKILMSATCRKPEDAKAIACSNAIEMLKKKYYLLNIKSEYMEAHVLSRKEVARGKPFDTAPISESILGFKYLKNMGEGIEPIDIEKPFNTIKEYYSKRYRGWQCQGKDKVKFEKRFEKWKENKQFVKKQVSAMFYEYITSDSLNDLILTDFNPKERKEIHRIAENFNLCSTTLPKGRDKVVIVRHKHNLLNLLYHLARIGGSSRNFELIDASQIPISTILEL